MSNLENMTSKLNEWGLGEYVQNFLANEITSEIFLSIDGNKLKELIPKVGPRLQFLKKGSEFSKEIHNNDQETSDTEEIATGANLSENQETIAEQDYQKDVPPQDTSSREANFAGIVLKNVLNQTGTGKALLKKNSLDSDDRKKLVLQVTEHLLANDKKRTRQIFEFWCSEITSVFSSEKKETYYLPAKPPTRKNTSDGN
ncbi:uncharacterized protein LOC127278598 [Leptopilina boulardi]|uniref:uncharacterized protein LOC127278598 n=1 Tax=Leptopilina boulardi TaxID=63433 RepID=UPI0021F578D2|nr:uncharacterized protein LOC127278598 [Leptopilina boulardi]